VNARTATFYREQRLLNARYEIRAVFRAGGMSDRELFDMLCMLGDQCGPEQAEWRDRLSTLTADLEPCEPDADAFRGLGPATLDARMERTA